MFPLDGPPEDLLLRAMDLERGAARFYELVLDRYGSHGFARIIKILMQAEEGHARIIYDVYQRLIQDAPPFEQLYGSMVGEVLEGGQSLEALQEVVAAADPDPCLDIVELAIDIEFAAYDLYRAMAERFRAQDQTMEAAFLSIAQAEKEHMRLAAEALAFCEE